MISKNRALTYILLLSTILLNGCDWLDSEFRTRKTTAQEIAKKIFSRVYTSELKIPAVPETNPVFAPIMDTVIELAKDPKTKNNLQDTLSKLDLPSLKNLRDSLRNINIAEDVLKSRSIYYADRDNLIKKNKASEDFIRAKAIDTAKVTVCGVIEQWLLDKRSVKSNCGFKI
ncbi:hypothetical protein [Candidatus Liberibacter sp.]|uniref:hypothetical protein n=1 Tax=Candidatus Liberibacter sp. TaxID=34022 RepID=UPI0015F41F26|nr:hypothetical protein [Candidatus Liberibacter sp.]MBA5724279.1 hypothetical protein [Candidatus Liberibacter sp.]